MPKEIETKYYECQYCGTRYRDKEDAEKCEKLKEEIKWTDFKPWHWYGLYTNYNPKIHWIFAKAVEVKGKNKTNCSCLNDCRVDVYDSNWNDYYSIIGSRSWIFDKEKYYLKIETAYERYGLIPGLRTTDVSKMPLDIIQRLENICMTEISNEHEKFARQPSSDVYDAFLRLMRPELFVIPDKLRPPTISDAIDPHPDWEYNYSHERSA